MTNIKLKSYENLFMPTSQKEESQDGTKLDSIELDKLYEFEGHPFKLYPEEKLSELSDSIKEHGVLSPIIVRKSKKQSDAYEIIAGHNRVEASKLAGLETIPAQIVEIDDDTATLMMVETNFNQRDFIPHSEKAFAYKMQVEALKRQGKRTDLTSIEDGSNTKPSNTLEDVAKASNTSRNQVHRYIRLTELIPDFLDMIDAGTLKFTFGVELSYLTVREQIFIFALENRSFSASNLKKLKEYSIAGNLTDELIVALLSVETVSKDNEVKEAMKELIKKLEIPKDKKELVILRALEKFCRTREYKQLITTKDRGEC